MSELAAGVGESGRAPIIEKAESTSDVSRAMSSCEGAAAWTHARVVVTSPRRE